MERGTWSVERGCGSWMDQEARFGECVEKINGEYDNQDEVEVEVDADADNREREKQERRMEADDQPSITFRVYLEEK